MEGGRGLPPSEADRLTLLGKLTSRDIGLLPSLTRESSIFKYLYSEILLWFPVLPFSLRHLLLIT